VAPVAAMRRQLRRIDPLLLFLVAPFLVATAIGLVVLWPSEVRRPAGTDAPDLGELVDGRVVQLASRPCAGSERGRTRPCVTPTVEVLEGRNEGRRVVLPEEPSAGAGTIELHEGDTVVLSYHADAEPGFRYALADFERRQPLIALGALFVIAVLATAGWRGLRALLGTAVSVVVVVAFILPALLDGSNPLAVSLVGAGVIGVLAIYLTHGVSTSSTTALLGTLASLALVGVLAVVFVELSHFTGLASEESSYLTISAGQIDLQGLLLGGIVIGTLGVLDDVTVTQVSAVDELRRANPGYRRRDLYRSAVSVGRDHIASAVNTLVLAYVGAALPLLLLFTQAGQQLGEVVTGEAVAVEVVRTLTGSIGLVASVPLTTALAAFVVDRRDRRPPPIDEPGRPVRSRGERRFWTDAPWPEALPER
jgi:uncharacterized membrane protein